VQRWTSVVDAAFPIQGHYDILIDEYRIVWNQSANRPRSVNSPLAATKKRLARNRGVRGLKRGIVKGVRQSQRLPRIDAPQIRKIHSQTLENHRPTWFGLIQPRPSPLKGAVLGSGAPYVRPPFGQQQTALGTRSGRGANE
jgi:hypothetical protein